MLQPRLVSGCGMGGRDCRGRMAGSFLRAACVVIFFSAQVLCQDINLNGEESIEASRIKREGVPENRDLTVLLVNDQQRGEYQSKVGRYHSVKPLIGLLTSTARTFIQDGVTTEFATQILGTTLNNGRIYAQLLTKSSLVLYNKPSNVDDGVLVKPTRMGFDGQWSVKQDLGFIDPDNFVLKNTDYLAPSSKMDIVYASKAVDNLKYWNQPSSPDSYSENQILEEPTGRKVQTSNEIPRYVQNEALNLLDGPGIESDKKFVVNPSILDNVNSLHHRQSKAYEAMPEVNKIDSRFKEEFNESNIVKVKPNHDLPTFTVKNEFSPVFYYIDNIESRALSPQAGQQSKSPKKLFGQKSEPRPKKTFTYVGFADFTTVVGDTVIIFTPNSEIIQDPGQVNVFPAVKQADKLATKITFLASDIPVATSTFKQHEAKGATKLATPIFQENRSEKALNNDEESLKKVLYEVDKMPDSISIQYNNGFGLNLDVIQPSEAVVSTTENTRLTDDLQVIPIEEYNSKPTDPLNTLKPSATILESPKESVVTESEINDKFTNSEEELDNTGAEVTEREEEATSAEESEEIVTTTESGHSEESYEDFEVTTEGIQEKPDPDEEICTKGLETKSTRTTAYKTLTYLTTYFIPLEGTETTTSIKSDVVVESQFGYLTNVVCKTVLDIEPTAVVPVNIKSSIQSSLEQPESISDEAITQLPPTNKEEVATENNPSTTQSENTTSDKKDESFEIVERIKEDTSLEPKESTTENVSTSQSHVEVSVSTEHSTTPTEKPIIDENSDEIDPSENEIDIIYKTLYTTYTYFTTFFGEATSSVASHKSVITNIITSTINLSQLDPSLLGAFNEDEISPTSVGIGRPTEAINSIIDLVKNKDVIESVQIADVYSSKTPTPSLDDDLIASINPDAVKTYFTTYTFFTTIYVGSDANVCSRSEVYTNYVGPDELIPTKINPLAESSKVQFDFRNCKQVKKSEQLVNPEENSSVETSISMEQNIDSEPTTEQTEQIKKDNAPSPSPVEVDMLFSIESNPLEDTSYVTDVKSSSSKGEQKYLENNVVLEDQVSSESNIEEIMPSPTLLLQTSYTTFTYFTTMYIGKDSSKVKSRLETITNVVTETITPKKEPEVEESNLPITYYTTFTYWTTLYKDKSTTITSREEIVSNVVYPSAGASIQVPSIANPIDTSPIDIDSELPPKNLEVELKASLIGDSLEQDDGKATFYTTYTYFTTFYVGNTSQIRSSLETVTNIVDNTKLIDDNQLGRKVPTGPADKNLIQDNAEKPKISPSIVKEEIKPTSLPDLGSAAPTVLLGTYIDNLYAEVKPADGSTSKPEGEKKILYSQVEVIAGNSVIITNENKSLTFNSDISKTTTTEGTIVSSPGVIQSSIADSEPTTEGIQESQEEEEEEGDDNLNSKKPGRLTFVSKKPTFTPVIRPFASRNRPTFSPKRVPLLSSATIITRSDFTPTITATPTLKSVRPSGFGGNRKQSAFPGSSSSRRFSGGRNNVASPSINVPVASRAGGFAKGSIQPTSRRSGFRSSSVRSNLDFASRSAAVPRIRPTSSSRLRGGRQSSSVVFSPVDEQNESETFATQQEENATEPLDEVTEAPVKTTSNPLLRFRRPLSRQPGTPVTPRSTTQSTTKRGSAVSRGRVTTTTRRPTNRPTTNPLLSLRRQRPNALFPRRNLFKQPDPEPEEEIKENEQNVDDQNDEILEGDDLDVDNDYDSSDRKEQQVATPSTPPPKKSNAVSIRPFRRRSKRQVDYGSRSKYTNFRRPGTKAVTNTRRSDPEPETEAPTTVRHKTSNNRFSSRLSSNTRTTTGASAPRSSARQPFIIRGESRTTTTSSPSFRRNSRPNTRTSTLSSRPKSSRLNSNYNSQTTSRSSSPRSSSGRSRSRGTTSKTNSRQRNSYESNSGERLNNFNHLVNDGKITVTHQIPVEVSIPVVNGKITEYKLVLTAKPSLQTLLQNQVSTSLGPLGNQVLVLADEATELADNGATKIIKFILHDTPTTTIIFTPTTIRGRKTSYSHILPSTVYNVEPITSTITPEISSNVPLANLLLSQLLLGNQQQAINPLLALQGQGLLPQQPQVPVAPTPATEYKTRTSTYVTTVTDNRETVLTITFRGTPILTTIKDPVVNVITATELITDTIVTTPTIFAPQQQPQFNSLLLPLLLQQQQQQQQQQLLATPNPLLGLGQTDLNLVQNNLLNNDIYSNSPKPNILSDLRSNDDYNEDDQDLDQESAEEVPIPPPPSSRSNKKRPKPAKPSPPRVTSIVTLYVSGRHPGEFSTVLSTVISEDTQTVRKREAIYFDDVKLTPSLLPSLNELTSSQSDNVLDNSLVSNLENYLEHPKDESQLETQSLESIVGEVSKHIKYDASPTINYVVKLATPSSNSLINEQQQSSVDDSS